MIEPLLSATPSLGASTRALWAGEEEPHPYGATQLPIAQSVAFEHDTLDEWQDVVWGRRSGYIHSRSTNPTVAVFEEKMRQLEGAEAATSFSSGMAAIGNTLIALVRPGERIVSMTDTYGATNQLFVNSLPRSDIDVDLCDTDDALDSELSLARPCRLVYIETPTNPTLKIVDIARLAGRAHAADAILVVDNTLATPINQTPLALGADLVVHSASQFLGGHGDALGGVLCGKRELVERVFSYREIQGASLDPFAAYLLVRGLKTLALRVERHNANALAVARFLEDHPSVEQVFYPGLASHPSHAMAAAQMRGFGGVLSFLLRSENAPTVREFLERLRFAHRAASLGHVETFAGIPATTSHVDCTAEERKAMGIPEALIRYSVGIEDISDLLTDLHNALR